MTEQNKDTSPLQEKAEIENATTDGMKDGEVRIIDGVQYTYVDVPTKTQKIDMLEKEIDALNSQLAEKEEKIKKLESEIKNNSTDSFISGVRLAGNVNDKELEKYQEIIDGQQANIDKLLKLLEAEFFNARSEKFGLQEVKKQWNTFKIQNL